jgi:hypothetical protein
VVARFVAESSFIPGRTDERPMESTWCLSPRFSTTNMLVGLTAELVACSSDEGNVFRR